jgi:hypothetical protein
VVGTVLAVLEVEVEDNMGNHVVVDMKEVELQLGKLGMLVQVHIEDMNEVLDMMDMELEVVTVDKSVVEVLVDMVMALEVSSCVCQLKKRI